MYRIVISVLVNLLVISVAMGQSVERDSNHAHLEPAASESTECQYSLTLAKTKFSQYEPILLTLAITNSSYKPLPVSLGYNREGGFIFTVKRSDGSIKELPPKITKETLTLLANFNVEAQKTYTQQLILNDWYDFKDPGVYEISASLAKGRRQAEQACLNSRFKIEIMPFDVAQLQQTCSALVETISQNVHNVGNAFDAVKALLAVKSPVIVPFLEQAVKANHAVTSYVISGLEEVGNEEAVRVLVSLLEEARTHPDNGEFLQVRNALFAIERKATDPATLDLVKITLAKVRE